jgi:AbrB family looped-hinge helix DNA binding protein
MTYTTVTSKGQIVIPLDIRQKLGIQSGFKMQVSVKNNQVIMEVDNYQTKLESFRDKTKKHIQKNKLNQISDSDIQQAKNDLWQSRQT